MLIGGRSHGVVWPAELLLLQSPRVDAAACSGLWSGGEQVVDVDDDAGGG